MAGKGASGKTTLLNALIDEIPKDKSGLVIQENEELFSHKHPDLMFQHIVTNKGESKVNYSLKELTINALLVDLDYIIIGEIKGGEALYFLNAAFTGHLGLCTLHGNSATHALDKLADYVKYESDYSKQEIIKMLSCVKTVVFMKNFGVNQIAEIDGWDEVNERLNMNVVYQAKPKDGVVEEEEALDKELLKIPENLVPENVVNGVSVYKEEFSDDDDDLDDYGDDLLELYEGMVDLEETEVM